MPGVIKSYIHTANQIGTLVELNCETKVTAMTAEFQTLAQEIAMQVAACPNVRYVTTNNLSDRTIKQIEKSLPLQTQQSDDVLKQHLKSLSLYDQSYIRDDSITIEDLIKLSMTQLAENITVKRFCRFAIQDSNDSNPPLDPGSGIPSNPYPSSPNPSIEQVETDA